MAAAIVRAVDPEQVYLFGSRARNQATQDADVDLLIVERGRFDEPRSRLRELRRIRRAVSAFRVPKDILVYSSEEVARWRHSANHIISRCLREGRLLYARS